MISTFLVENKNAYLNSYYALDSVRAYANIIRAFEQLRTIVINPATIIYFYHHPPPRIHVSVCVCYGRLSLYMRKGHYPQALINAYANRARVVFPFGFSS